MSKSKGVSYDEDDMYDYDDEEDFYGDYGSYDPGEQKVASKPAKVLPLLACNCSRTLHSCNMNVICPVQAPIKSAGSSRASSAKKSGNAASQSAASAGASALAQTLLKRPAQKGGELKPMQANQCVPATAETEY